MDWLLGVFRDKNIMLYEAIQQGNLERVRWAIQKGADPNMPYPERRPIFFSVVNQDNLEILRYLLDHSADVNIPSYDDEYEVDMTIQELVAYDKPREWLQVLDEHGARWNDVYREAIISAGRGLNRDAIEYLMTKIDINYVSTKEGYEGTVLHNAIRNEDVELDFIRFLLDSGVNINTPTHLGVTPLMVAIYFPDILQLLIQRGANINYQSTDGATALHYAVMFQKMDTIRILIEAGANTQLQDEQGRTPLDIATENNNQAIIDILEGEGPISIDEAEYKGELVLQPGITNSITYEKIKDGDEVIVIFGKTTSPNYIYKREGIEGWFNLRKQQHLTITNPMTNERIKKQSDLTRYTARVVGENVNSNNNINGDGEPSTKKQKMSRRKRRGGGKRTRRQRQKKHQMK